MTQAKMSTICNMWVIVSRSIYFCEQHIAKDHAGGRWSRQVQRFAVCLFIGALCEKSGGHRRETAAPISAASLRDGEGVKLTTQSLNSLPVRTFLGYRGGAFAAPKSRHGERTQSVSLLGVKRTCLFAPHMSANDPKRTYHRNFRRSLDQRAIPEPGLIVVRYFTTSQSFLSCPARCV
jgi:hypothetical protein